jgi:hypothetical protein
MCDIRRTQIIVSGLSWAHLESTSLERKFVQMQRTPPNFWRRANTYYTDNQCLVKQSRRMGVSGRLMKSVCPSHLDCSVLVNCYNAESLTVIKCGYK